MFVVTRKRVNVHTNYFLNNSVLFILCRTYAEGDVKYSYAVELRDTGRHGFLLPKEEILPSSEETFAAVVHLANFIRKREKQWRY